MKKCILRLLNLIGILCTMCLMSVSCKTIDSSQLTVDSFEVQKFRSVDTVVVRDSVFVSEKMRGDTVYLTRVEWRDRWRTRMVHDTIVRTDSIVQFIEHPPRKYIPSFHKWSTVALWILIALSIVYLILRSKIHAFHL